MLEIGLLKATNRCESISRRHDIRHLRQPTQERRRCPGKLSSRVPLGIEVLVVRFGKVVSFAPKQANDPRGGMGGCLFPAYGAIVRTSSQWLV